jgi:hypothetical protein
VADLRVSIVPVRVDRNLGPRGMTRGSTAIDLRAQMVAEAEDRMIDPRTDERVDGSHGTQTLVVRRGNRRQISRRHRLRSAMANSRFKNQLSAAGL